MVMWMSKIVKRPVREDYPTLESYALALERYTGKVEQAVDDLSRALLPKRQVWE